MVLSTSSHIFAKFSWKTGSPPRWAAWVQMDSRLKPEVLPPGSRSEANVESNGRVGMSHDSWYIHDIFMIYSWYIHDIFMIYSWYIHDISIIYTSVIHLSIIYTSIIHLSIIYTSIIHISIIYTSIIHISIIYTYILLYEIHLDTSVVSSNRHENGRKRASGTGAGLVARRTNLEQFASVQEILISFSPIQSLQGGAP